MYQLPSNITIIKETALTAWY